MALALMFAVACGSKSNKHPQASSTQQAAAVSATPSPQALIDRATTTLDALQSFHFVLSHENGTTPIAEGISMRRAEGDFVKPDRFKGTIDGTAQGGFTISPKVISVGDNVWIALVDDTYLSLQNGIGAAAILDPQSGVLKAARNIQSPAISGTDTINGVPTTVVSGTIDAGQLTALDQAAQPGKSVNVRLWIGSADSRIYRLRLEGPLNDQEPPNIARQIDLSKFNEQIDIQTPPAGR